MTEKVNIDLNPIANAVGKRILHDTLQVLANEGLLEKREGLFYPKKMTSATLGGIVTAVEVGLNQAFKNTWIKLPEGHVIEEVSLIDNMLEGQGKPTVKVLNNALGIKYDGERPLFRRILTPIDEAKSETVGNRVHGITPNITINTEKISVPTVNRLKQ